MVSFKNCGEKLGKVTGKFKDAIIWPDVKALKRTKLNFETDERRLSRLRDWVNAPKWGGKI